MARPKSDKKTVNMRLSAELLDKLDSTLSFDRTTSVSIAMSFFTRSKSCLVCGAMNDEEGDFCSVCGAPLFTDEEIIDGMACYSDFSDKAYFLDCPEEMQESYRIRALELIKKYKDAGMIPIYKPRYHKMFVMSDPERYKISVSYLLPDDITEVKPAINLDFGVCPEELGNYLLKKHFERFDAAHRKFHGCGLPSIDFYKYSGTFAMSGKHVKKE